MKTNFAGIENIVGINASKNESIVTKFVKKCLFFDIMLLNRNYKGDKSMSKYDPLWKYIQEKNEDKLLLSFAEVKEVLGFPIDHSFLNYKKELLAYGYQVGKISLKEQTVKIERVKK